MFIRDMNNMFCRIRLWNETTVSRQLERPQLLVASLATMQFLKQ